MIKKATADIRLNSEELDALPLRLATRQGGPLFPDVFGTVPESWLMQ